MRLTMVTLTYKDTTLEFRNPLFGNSSTLEFTRISRDSLGGDTIVFRENNWPIVEKLNLTFEILRCINYKTNEIKENIDGAREFLKKTLGQEVTYVDHDGKIWKVLILNPNTAIKQVRLSTYVLALELEAEPV